ncbi:MAG: TIGR00366 family protein [Enterobacterales bacterium]|nr:TIGR00366 family protein [Enterobacterales bacterium]
MIKNSADWFSRKMQRWLPDAFVIAILLTLVVFMAGMLLQQQSVQAMANHWGGGFWKLLSFSMQMLLILVLGSVVATSTPIKVALNRLAGVARTPSQAVVLVTLVSLLAAWLNWGFGLIVGALVAKRIAHQVKDVDFPLLIASAYSGMLIWHSGLSGSIPLKIASSDQDALSQLMQNQVFDLSQTIFAWQNLLIIALLVITLPILNWLMMPNITQRKPLILAKDETLEVVQDVLSSRQTHSMTPAERLEQSPIINALLVILGSAYLINYFYMGGGINLNLINLCLLLAGLLLHRTPSRFLKAVNLSIASSSGIIIQFPIYAGIMGMMVGSGLAASLSEWFISIADSQSFPLLTFISAGIVNFFCSFWRWSMGCSSADCDPHCNRVRGSH